MAGRRRSDRCLREKLRSPGRPGVLVIRRPRYACRACEEAVVQAPAPARLIEGGLPTDALVAQVLVSAADATCPWSSLTAPVAAAGGAASPDRR